MRGRSLLHRLNVMCRFFEKLPVSSPSFVQVDNKNFGNLIDVLVENTAQMLAAESKTQLLLKYRLALHLLFSVNEDSRLLVLKLDNILAGLRCGPLPHRIPAPPPCHYALNTGRCPRALRFALISQSRVFPTWLVLLCWQL
jgi:hypothetical protein